MNQSLTGLLEGIRRSLRDDVQPELSSDHTRTQLAGVLDILGKLERMIVWSPDSMRERLEVMEAGAKFIEVHAAAAGFAAPVSDAPVLAPTGPSALRHSDLEQAMRQAEQRLVMLTDWLFEPASALPAALRSELDAKLRGTLAAALRIERSLIPRADFSSMTGTTS